MDISRMPSRACVASIREDVTVSKYVPKLPSSNLFIWPPSVRSQIICTIPIDGKTAVKELRPFMSGKLHQARLKSLESATRNESCDEPKLLTYFCQFYYTAEISKIKLIVTNVLFHPLV